jgi:hypothetical protein
MKRVKTTCAREVALPWSDGTLSARLWRSGERTIAGVPELGLHCYGNSQAEAVFRLFTSLLKYYRQLKTFKTRLGRRGLEHLELLSKWIESIENKMTAPSSETKVLAIGSSRKH